MSTVLTLACIAFCPEGLNVHGLPIHSFLSHFLYQPIGYLGLSTNLNKTSSTFQVMIVFEQ